MVVGTGVWGVLGGLPKVTASIYQFYIDQLPEDVLAPGVSERERERAHDKSAKRH